MDKVAYIFPGQGAQYVGMGKEFYDNFPAARDIFQKAGRILGFDITALCFEGPLDELTKTANVQPAIFTVSIAGLYAFRESASNLIAPKALLGLSLGEYSALVAGKAIAFTDALILVRKRGELMEEASFRNPGKMASIIGLAPDGLDNICKKTGSELANLNCPGQVVITGTNEAVDKAMAMAKDAGARKVIALNVSGPFHSSLMEPAAAKLKKELEKVAINTPEIPIVSNTTAAYTTSPGEIKTNLINQVKGTVKWEDSVCLVAQDGVSTFLEIGPGKVLKGLLRRINPDLKVYNIETKEDIAGFNLS